MSQHAQQPTAGTGEHPAFERLDARPIESLNIVVESYRHRRTGAMHYHLAADNPENVFTVAFRTMPMNHTGVAHILEHTALCGSEKYPVRDPFFMMLRRSLNTFMNAMTSSDWTAYPFATCNRKDFDNLLGVYLDAAFFSRLDPLDFAQEGHRIEFAEPDNPNSALMFKGVVFNEMKGAMSSVPATLWQTLTTYLYPTTTYHFNSGGDPASIPDLSYEQLQQFYRTHYHPGNAVFMTFGDIPAAELHARIEELALGRFDSSIHPLSVADEKRYLAPLRVTDYYALDEEDDGGDRGHVVTGWLWGRNTSLDDLLEALLLDGVLLDHSGSPLRLALERSELGSAPSALCGLEDSNRELVFVCGLEGTADDATEAVEQLIIDTLEEIARDGVPHEQVEAVLHQIELHQCEIGGDSYPYGLQMIMQSLGAAIHHGDPIDVLDIEPALERLRRAVAEPDYVQRLVRKLLLDNHHRVTLTMLPDRELSARRDLAERERLDRIAAGLDHAERQRLVEQAAALAERQAHSDDLDILPKVGLDDVPADVPNPVPNDTKLGEIPLTVYHAGTNGLVYQQVLFELPPLNDAELDLLPYYTAYVTELGIGDDSYLQTQQHQAEVVGSLSAFTSIRGSLEDPQTSRGLLVFSSKALTRNYTQMAALLRDTLAQVRFDEFQRLRDLVAHSRSRREQSITGSGHALAMLAASSGFSPVAALSHRTGGIEGIRRLRRLDASLADDSTLEAFAGQLAALHRKLTAGEPRLLTICEDDHDEVSHKILRDAFGDLAGTDGDTLNLPPSRSPRSQIWQANTQVNFCAKAYPTVALGHADAAPLAVLGGLLRNGYLHTAIREKGGAYGAGAQQESNLGVFRFFSYRDPRLEETLGDFDRAVTWVLESELPAGQIEEAVLGVVGTMDRPGSPAGEARQHYHNRLFGRSDEARKQYRRRVLDVTEADLKRVAAQYLVGEKAAIAVVTSSTRAAELEGLAKQWSAELCDLGGGE